MSLPHVHLEAHEHAGIEIAMSLFERLPHVCERVRLRRLRASDFRNFHAYRSDADVARYQGWAAMSEAEATETLREYARNAGLEPGEWAQIGIAALDDDRLIGDLGVWLSPDGRLAEFSVSLHREFQRTGLGFESAQALIALLFANTFAQRVVAATDARNLACITLLQRLGMRLGDTAEADCKGEACIEHVYVIERGRSAS